MCSMCRGSCVAARVVLRQNTDLRSIAAKKCGGLDFGRATNGSCTTTPTHATHSLNLRV